MAIFDENEAQHYCATFNADAGHSAGSLIAYRRAHLNNRTHLTEGTSEFNHYRDCCLRNVERSLFLAASNFTRTHNVLLASASGWAYVTLYYSSYYAAVALLGMFGMFIDAPNFFIDVEIGTPGSQKLKIYRNQGNGRNTMLSRTSFTGKASHKMFWDLFYKEMQQLQAWITEPSLLRGIQPVGGDPFWQINNRNEINYDTHKAIALADAFQRQCRRNRFPSSLPGILNTQYEITKATNLIAFSYAKKFKVQSDALAPLKQAAQRRDIIRQFILTPRSVTSSNAIKSLAFD